MTSRPLIGLATASALLCLTIAGCGGPGDGGSTTCGDFTSMSGDDQKQVIKDYLSEKGDSDAGSLKVGATRLSALAYCKTVGSDSSPISGIGG